MKKTLPYFIYLILALALIASLFTLGCSTTQSTGGASSSTAKSGTSTSQAQAGGILKIASSTDFQTFGDPPTMTMASDLKSIRCCVEELINFDAAGAPAPGLATSWKADTNAKTLTLSLKNGIKFHDGTDFNASAVKWNLDRYVASKRADLASIKSVDVVDDYTVRLNLTQNSGVLLFYLGQYGGLMVSPTAWQNGGSDDKARTTKAQMNPVGTGPFKFVSWQKDVGAKFVKFADYWQKGKPYLDEIDFTLIADPVVAQASFLKGDVDVLQDIRDPKVARDLETTGKYNITISNTAVVTLAGDSEHPNSVYSKVKVRQAVWYAVDTKAIASTLGYGYWQSLNQYSLPDSWAYNSDVKGYPYNPEKAKQLLSEAGYPSGFQTKIITSNAPPWPDEAAAMQKNLAAVGIQATIELRDFASWIQAVSRTGWNDALMLSMVSQSPNEYANQVFRFARGTTAKSPVVLTPDEYCDLIDKASAAPDFEAMKPIAQQMARMAVDQYCIQIYPYTQPSIVAKNGKLRDDNLNAGMSSWTPSVSWLAK